MKTKQAYIEPHITYSLLLDYIKDTNKTLYRSLYNGNIDLRDWFGSIEGNQVHIKVNLIDMHRNKVIGYIKFRGKSTRGGFGEWYPEKIVKSSVRIEMR